MFSAVQLKAQLTNYNLYMQNGYLYNPAFTYDQEIVSAYLNTHIQWVGFEGAPESKSFGIHGPINKNMGLGLNLVNLKHGIMNNFNGQISYSYRGYFSEKHYFSLGVAGGLLSDKLNSDNLTGNVIANDPNLINNLYNQSTLSASAGINYFVNNLEAQVIFPQLYQRKVSNLYTIGVLAYNFNLSSGNVLLKPSFMVRGTKFSSTQFDGNLMAQFSQKVWIQAGYRSSGSTIIGAGVNFKGFKLGYAYQIDNKELSGASNGTHEIQLIFNFGENWYVEKPKVVKLEGEVKNSFTNEPIMADVTIYDEVNTIVYTTKTDAAGKYKTNLNLAKTYKIEVKADGYVASNQELMLLAEDNDKVINANLKPSNTTFIGKTKPENSFIKIYDEKAVLIFSGQSDATGSYKATLEPCKTYKIDVTNENYVSQNQTFTMPCDKMEFSKETELVAYVVLKGSVKNKETGDLMTATMKIVDETGKVVQTSIVTGTIETKLIEGKYTIEISGDKIMTLNETISLTKATSKDFFLDIKVIPVSEDKTFKIGVVKFETGKSVLTADSYLVLDELVKIMKDNKDLKIEIGGHTDDVGSETTNQKISQERSEACKTYIVSKGIDASRLNAIGYGESKPLVPNTSTENRAKNRRTELKIIN